MPWWKIRAGLPVERIRGRNKGRRGVVVAKYSPSGTITVQYGPKSFGRFVNPDDFKFYGE